MKLLVCYKVGPDLDKVVDEDWEGFTTDTDLSYANRIINCFDESALEIALRLKEMFMQEGQPVECCALTAGKAPPAAVSQTLFAAGFDQVAVIKSNLTDFAPTWTASELAAYAGQGGYDLVLTGRQAGLADTGSVPFLLAEALGFPVVGEVETVSAHPHGITVVHNTDSGHEQLTLRLPAVLAIGNSPVAALRAVTLRAKLAAAKRQITDCQPQNPTGSPPAPTLTYEKRAYNCRFITGREPQETMLQLLGEMVCSKEVV